MSDLNLIATEKDNKEYDINTIAKNLSWVIPGNIINSSPNSPVLWKQYMHLKNLSNSCIVNQSIIMQNGSENGCTVLYDEIIKVNPDAIVVSDETTIEDKPIKNKSTLDSNEESPDNTLYIIIGIIILFIILVGGFSYYQKHKHNSYLEDTDTDTNPDLDTDFEGGYFTKGE